MTNSDSSTAGGAGGGGMEVSSPEKSWTTSQ